MDIIEQTLSNMPLFASLSPAKLQQLIENLHYTEISQGSVLFQEGELGDCFYIILDGQLEVIKSMGTENERLLDVHNTGEFLGEISMFDRQGRRTASVRARTDARLLQMTHFDLNQLLHQEPDLGFELVRELSLRLRDAQAAAIQDLQKKNIELIQAYSDLKNAQAQIIEKERLERELQVARKIQESMLPVRLPSLEGFDFGARMLPARAVGGDFFDFIPLQQGMLGIVIGDVSDKGVPAALFMALARSLLRSEARRSPSPATTLLNVNENLLEMNAAGMFVTVLYGVLDAAARRFTYARGGHEIPFLFDAQGQEVPLPFSNGQLLGILPKPTLDEQVVTIPAGGTLLLYTDGATDATDGQGVRLGYERLLVALQASLGAPAQNFCDRMVEAINIYQSGSPQADDITLVAVQSKS